ncbi:Hypothetical predicted protein, partial [Mytilus galloprovincialis]
MTRGVFTFLLVVCVTATITEGYGSYRHGGIVGHTGLYKNHLTSYKDLLTGYGNDHAAGHFHKIVVGRLYRRFHQFGIDLIGNGLRYKNYFYHYHVRSLEFIWTMTSCYNSFHHASICVPKLQKQGLIGAPHPLTGYVGRNTGYHGFKIVHGRFSYHGHGYHGYDQLGFKIVHGGFSYHGKAYTLKCSESRFYKVWDDCYGHYHKGSLCFDRLFKQGLFGYNVDSDYAHGDIDYLGYYNSHHGFHLVDGGFTYKDVGYHGYDQLGFKIVHGGFSYHGKAYTLKCSESRFYKVWDDCYGHYHKGSVCFDRLFKQGLFGYNVDSDYAHGDIDYLGYYNSHHGFHLVDGGFTYKDVAYKLSCKTDRFYRSWHDCYDSYHSVDVCFGRLYKSHLFVSLDHGDVHTVHTNYHGYKYLGFRVNHRRFTYHGKGYYHGASSIVHGGNYVDDFGYYKAHHGFSIVNGGFSYNGAGYYHGSSSIVHSGDYIDDFGYYKAHHGFSIVNGGFSYNGAGGGHGYTNYHGYKYLGFRIRHRRFSYLGKAYRLKFGTRRFYKLWDDCYNTFHDRSVCFNNLYKRHIFGYYHGSSSVVHGSDYINDFGYYKAHHGFSIVNGGFSYNGA